MERSRFFDLESALQFPEQVRSLSLYRRGLEAIPKEIFSFPQLEELDLSGNRLRNLSPNLSRLNHLRILRLDENQLNSLPSTTDWPPELQQLFLRGNTIREPEGLPAGLTHLDLSGNPISVKEAGGINGLNLRHLMLEEAKLTRIPAAWKSFRKLEVLSLKGNRISRLPDLSDHWPKLRELNLSANRIRDWEISPTCCLQLEQIDLSENRLKVLPESWPAWTQLRILNLAGNSLRQLPEKGWENMPWLSRLILRKNQLEHIPDAIRFASRIQLLDLSRNKLPDLPPQIGDLNRLRHLDLERNPLMELPDTLANCPVQELVLRRTGINSVPEIVWQMDRLNKLTGIRGAGPAVRFLHRCVASGISVGFRSLFFTIYRNGSYPQRTCTREELLEGMKLNLPALHHHLWEWYRQSTPAPELKEGSPVFLPKGHRLRKDELEAAGIRLMEDPGKANIWLVSGRMPMPTPGVQLLAVGELQDWMRSIRPRRVPLPKSWERLVEFPTDGNLLLLCGLLKKSDPAPDEQARLLATWIRAEEGPGRSALRRLLQNWLNKRLPGQPDVKEDSIRSLVEGTSLDPKWVLRHLE